MDIASDIGNHRLVQLAKQAQSRKISLEDADKLSCQSAFMITGEELDQLIEYARQIAKNNSILACVLLNLVHNAALSVDDAERSRRSVFIRCSLFARLGHAEEAINTLQGMLETCHWRGDIVGAGEVLNALGNIYHQLGNVDSAMEHFKQALDIHRTHGHSKHEANNLVSLGNLYGNFGQTERAVQHMEQALNIYQMLNDKQGESVVVGNLGAIYQEQGKIEFALKLLKQGLKIDQEIGNRKHEGISLGNIGNLYRDLCQFEDALNYYQLALTVCQEIGDRLGEGWNISNIGAIHGYKGELHQAVEDYQKSISISRETGDKNGEISDLASLGAVYRDLGELEKAIDCYKMGLPISREVGYAQGESKLLLNLGVAYLDLCKYEEALDCFNQGLAISKNIKHSSNIIKFLTNIGSVYIHLNDYSKANNDLKQAHEHISKIGDRYGEGIVMDNLGDLEREQGNFDKALDYYKNALLIHQELSDRKGELHCYYSMGIILKALGQYDNTINSFRQGLNLNRNIGFLELQWQILRQQAETLSLKGMLMEALISYSQALDLIERQRSGITDDTHRRALGRMLSEITREAVPVAVKNGDLTTALLILERGKGRVLSEQLIRMNRLPANLPNALRVSFRNAWENFTAAQRALEIEIRRTEQNLPERQQPADFDARLKLLRAHHQTSHKRIQAAHTKLEKTQDNLDSIVKKIHQNDPDFAISFHAPAISWNEIQTLAPKRDNAALLHIALTNEGTFVFITQHKEEKPRIIEIKSLTSTTIIKMLQNWLNDYRNWINDHRNYTLFLQWCNTISRTLGRLKELLWAHIILELKTLGVSELILIPHSYYNLLPLHAVPEVIEQFTINYAPAISIIKLCQERIKQINRHGDHMLVVNNPTSDLAFAPIECEEICKLFTNHNQLSQKAATRKNLALNVCKANILHFSGHGSFNWNFPFKSGLKLSDGFITLTEIQREIDLNCCRLVVLSACETGITDPRDIQDEFLGLPAGFLMAGTPAVISSLWAVNDLSTTLLIVRFYQYYLNDKMRVDKALCRAQIWLRDISRKEVLDRLNDIEQTWRGRRNESELAQKQWEKIKQTIRDVCIMEERPFASPFYWAAFQVTGAVS